MHVSPHPISPATRRPRPLGITILAILHALAMGFGLVAGAVFVASTAKPTRVDVAFVSVYLLGVGMFAATMLLLGAVASGLWRLKRQALTMTRLMYPVALAGQSVALVRSHDGPVMSLVTMLLIAIYVWLPRTVAAFEPSSGQ